MARAWPWNCCNAPSWWDVSYDDLALVGPGGMWLLHLGVSDELKPIRKIALA